MMYVKKNISLAAVIILSGSSMNGVTGNDITMASQIRAGRMQFAGNNIRRPIPSTGVKKETYPKVVGTYPNEINIKNNSSSEVILEIMPTTGGFMYLSEFAPGEVIEKYNINSPYHEIKISAFRKTDELPLRDKTGPIYVIYSDSGIKEVTPQEWEEQVKSAIKKVDHGTIIDYTEGGYK